MRRPHQRGGGGRHHTKTATEARNEEVSARPHPRLLAIIGDLERVGDIFFQMSKQLERKMADRLWFSPNNARTCWA